MLQRLIIIASLSFMLFISCSDSSSGSDNDTLPQTLHKVYEQSQLPGFSLAVVKNGTVDYTASYGYANLSSNKPWGNNTVMPIASLTKGVIGVAVAKAIELNYFTLKTPINNLLPFKVVNPYTQNDTIRVQHLVTHTSGIKDDVELFFETYTIPEGALTQSKGSVLLVNSLGASVGETAGLKELVSAYFPEDGSLYDADNFIKAAAGEKYQYSNFSTALMGYIIEYKSGMDLRLFVQKYVFDPLYMQQTRFGYSENSDENATLYYTKGDAYPPYSTAAYPSGGIHSSVHDLSLFLQEMIKGSQGKGTLLNAKHYTLLFTKLWKSGQDNTHAHSIYWFLSGDIIEHAGTDLGVVSKLEFNPKTGSGYVFLTNSEVQFSEHGAENINAINSMLYKLKDYTY